jgi:5'-3' exonuclease
VYPSSPLHCALPAPAQTGTAEDVEKYGKRTIKVTKEHNEECKKLLRLMGVPVVEAPCEAEATCAALAAAGKVYAAASEDMDTLTFGATKLARNLMKPASAESPILEFDYAAALRELNLSREAFVDLCILCGCDYTDAIKGCGPVTALKLIREHGTIEAVIAHIKASESKLVIPEYFPYQEARQLFLQPEVVDVQTLPEFKWTPPDEEGLLAFLVGEKTFAEDRVRKSIEKIKAAKGKASQNRMESFFGCVLLPRAVRLCGCAAVRQPRDTRMRMRPLLLLLRLFPRACAHAWPGLMHASPRAAAQRTDGDQVDAEAPRGGPQGQGEGKREGRGCGWRKEEQGRGRRQEVSRAGERENKP